MLDEKTDILMAKIIAFTAGIDGEGQNNQFIEEIKEAILAIKNNKKLDLYINKFIELKNKYLANCLTCKSPCGKSNDYHINNLSEDVRENKIKLFQELCNDIDKLPDDEIIYQIIRLSW